VVRRPGRRLFGARPGVLTGCALAVAQTGTVVLDHGPGQGRRALTLLADLHVCVVLAHQVVASVAEAIATEPRRAGHEPSPSGAP
jgi:L-lactate dehydrogenase complex protein LldG